MLIQYLVLIFTCSHWKPHVTKKRKERVRGVSMKYIPCQAAGSERTLPWYVDRWMDSPGYGVQRRPGSLLDGRRRSLSSPRRKNRVSLTFDSRNMPASSIIIIHTIPSHAIPPSIPSPIPIAYISPSNAEYGIPATRDGSLYLPASWDSYAATYLPTYAMPRQKTLGGVPSTHILETNTNKIVISFPTTT